MTPFDVTYAHEFLIQQEFASAPQHQIAVRPASTSAQPASASTRAYMLRDAAAHGPSAPAQPRSLQTPSYTEFLLQIIDRDSMMTSLLFIAAYVGLMQAL